MQEKENKRKRKADKPAKKRNKRDNEKEADNDDEDEDEDEDNNDAVDADDSDKENNDDRGTVQMNKLICLYCKIEREKSSSPQNWLACESCSGWICLACVRANKINIQKEFKCDICANGGVKCSARPKVLLYQFKKSSFNSKQKTKNNLNNFYCYKIYIRIVY